MKFRTQRGELNIIIEVDPETRKKQLQTKWKMGWLICSVGDYIMAKMFYNCSRYNHRHQMCKAEEERPLCAGRHSLKDSKTHTN